MCLTLCWNPGSGLWKPVNQYLLNTDIGGILACALQSSVKREQKPKGFSWNPQFQAHRGRVSEWKLCLGRCSCWSLTLSGVRDQAPSPLVALMTSLLSFLSESQLKRPASWSAIRRRTHSSSTYAFLFHWINPYYMSLQMKKNLVWIGKEEKKPLPKGRSLALHHTALPLSEWTWPNHLIFWAHGHRWTLLITRLKTMAGKIAPKTCLTHHRYSTVSDCSFTLVFPQLVERNRICIEDFANFSVSCFQGKAYLSVWPKRNSL